MSIGSNRKCMFYFDNSFSKLYFFLEEKFIRGGSIYFKSK